MFRVVRGATALALAFAFPVVARAEPLLHFKAGETVSIHGQAFEARRDGVAYVSLSSEYISVAVLSGRLKSGHVAAGAGDILITPIEGARAERFMFDAARLGQTLSPDLLAEASPLLQPIAARQKRQRFLGLIEPVGLNAETPAPPAIEGLRRSYLSPDIVISLRRQAHGDAATLNRLTAERFVQAVAAQDTASVAALLDPKPFTDISADTDAWQDARTRFAAQLVAQDGLAGTLGKVNLTPDPNEPDAWIIDNGTWSLYRLRIVDRDRAAYVAALEAL